MSTQKRILVIEDDQEIAGMLALNLKDEGFVVTVEASGEAGLTRLKNEPQDLLILDLMLPGIDGLEVCRRVRGMDGYLPIIILSAKSAEAHRVLGLELGADDYLTKPFSVPELAARVRAVLRRFEAAMQTGRARAGVISLGELVIDPVARELKLGEKTVPLTAREFDLLLFFARQPGRVFNRIQLLNEVWGYNHDGYEHTVNSHINRLRAKIEKNPAQPDYIQTVWGVGYKFTLPAKAQ